MHDQSSAALIDCGGDEGLCCRWAMLGAAGCIAPEILATAGVIPQTPDEVIWFKSGVIPPAGVYDK